MNSLIFTYLNTSIDVQNANFQSQSSNNFSLSTMKLVIPWKQKMSFGVAFEPYLFREVTIADSTMTAFNFNDEDFLLYSGDDISACNFLSNGGHGIVSVTANVIPDKMAKICDLSLKGFIDKAVEEDNKLNDLHQALFLETSPIPVKWILNRLGRIPSGIRLPLTELDPRYHKKIELIIEKHGLLK